jgi:hypothetical protein
VADWAGPAAHGSSTLATMLRSPSERAATLSAVPRGSCALRKCTADSLSDTLRLDVVPAGAAPSWKYCWLGAPLMRPGRCEYCRGQAGSARPGWQS